MAMARACLLLALALLHLAHAQTTPSDFQLPDNRKDLPKNTRSLSTDSPLTQETLSPPSAAFHTLQAYIEKVDDAVVTAAARSRDGDGGDNPFLTTCNAIRNEWLIDVQAYFFKDDVFDAVVQRSAQLDIGAPGFAQRLGLDWAAPTRAQEFQYNLRTQRCTHDYAAAIRVDGFWFVESRVSNEEQEKNLAKNMRENAYEYSHVDVDDVRTANLILPSVDALDDDFGGGTSPPGVPDTSTVLFKTEGDAAASAFGVIFSEDNVAVQAALRSGEHQVQQASDATTPSNIAILALPLAMNLVPVALIADVNTAGMLIYALLTDVLTAVPLAIKGVEVLGIGLQRHRSVITRISGAQLDRSNVTKAAEIFAAECSASADLTPIGAIFLAVALLAMVGGVAAEYAARRYVRRKRWSVKVVGEDAWDGDSEALSGSAALMGPVSAASAPHMLSPPQAAGLILARTGRENEPPSRASGGSSASASGSAPARWGVGGMAALPGAVGGGRRNVARERERGAVERGRAVEGMTGGVGARGSGSGQERWAGASAYEEKIE